LEFDSQFPPFNKVERVIYSQKYNEVSAFDLLRSRIDPNYQKNLPTLWSDKITKSPCWEYEQEYRIFDDANKVYEFDPLACIIRSMAISENGPCRSLKTEHADHLNRTMLNTFS